MKSKLNNDINGKGREEDSLSRFSGNIQSVEAL
jgi:hypothetical protein